MHLRSKSPSFLENNSEHMSDAKAAAIARRWAQIGQDLPGAGARGHT